MNAVIRRLPLLVALALHAPAYADDDQICLQHAAAL